MMNWLRGFMFLVLFGVLAACGSSGGGGDARPTISSFAANPSTIQEGQSSTLSWNVTGATTLTLNPGNIDVTGQTSRVVSPESTTTYTLTATNADGSTLQSTTVNVTTGGDAETFSKHGYVMMQEMGSPGGEFSMVSGTGNFFSTEEPQPVPNEEDFLNNMTDTCTVFTEGEAPPDPDPVPLPRSTSLDAGPVLTVNAGGNAYATLERQTIEESILYSTNFMNPPALPLPDSGLTVSIPGAQDGFPAFTNRAFGDVPAFTLTAPADPDNITNNTAFSWSGSSSTSAVVLMGSGQNTSDQTVMFYCLARDDGSFVLPAATQNELTSRGFTTGSLMMAGRNNYEIYREDDAVLYLVTARYTFFGGLQ